MSAAEREGEWLEPPLEGHEGPDLRGLVAMVIVCFPPSKDNMTYI